MTLEQIITKERKCRTEKGDFGIIACKEAIKERIEHALNFGMSITLYDLLAEYVRKANNDIFFNKAMVLACWELINEE